MAVCPICGGEGGFWAIRDLATGRRVPPIRYPMEGPADVWEECPLCEGAGEVREEAWEDSFSRTKAEEDEHLALEDFPPYEGLPF